MVRYVYLEALNTESQDIRPLVGILENYRYRRGRYIASVSRVTKWRRSVYICGDRETFQTNLVNLIN